MTPLRKIIDNFSYIRRAATNSVLLSSGTVVAGIIGFVQTVILSTYLDPEVFGTYRYLIAFIGSLGIFSLPGLTTALYQSLSRQKKPSIGKLVKIRFLSSLLGSAFVIIYSNIQLNNGAIGTDLFWGYVAIAAIYPLTELWNIYDPILLSSGKYKTLALLTIVQRLTTALTAIALTFISPLIVALTIGFLLSITLFRLIVFIKIGVPKYEAVRTDTQSTLSFSWKLTLIGIVNIIGTYFDKIFLFHGLGAYELAAYSMAVIFADQAKMVVKHMGTIELKNFVVLRGRGAIAYMKKRTNFLLLLMIPLYLMYIAGVYIFFMIVPKFSEVIPLAALYGTVLFLSTKVYHRAFLEAHQQSKRLMIFNLFSTISKIIFVITFSKTMGLQGVIIALVLSELITWIVLEVLTKKLAAEQDTKTV